MEEINKKAKRCPKCGANLGIPGFIKVLIVLAIIFGLCVSCMSSCTDAVNDSIEETENEYKDINGKTSFKVGESFENKLGDPISKIYEDATISAAVTNIYSESSETSEIVGKLEKYTVVTAQKFEQGWSRVSGTDSNGIKISGWTKTANVSYSDNQSLTTSPTIQTGTVTAEPYLNVRLNPNTNATILTKVNKGEKVNIEDSANGWYKITVNGVTGWVSADFVK
jgi:uncharacterized protein YgiM (DUF1202 family)